MAEYICREAIIKDLEKEIEAGDAAYDISRFNHNDEEIFVPVKCPNCGAEMERNDINE